MKVNIGDKFGKLTVISLASFIDNRQMRNYAICNCSCGRESFAVRIDSLIKTPTSSRKPSRSCGCLQRESVTKHGVWNHPLYPIWSHMMKRCYDQTDKKYPRYGQRGITVCKEWHDVNQFIADMNHTYQPGLQINRIDNDQGYYKENCNWATRIEQAHNKSGTVLITYNGITQSIRQWSTQLGINYGTLVERLRVLNWPIDKALTQPPRQGNYKPWNKKVK